MNKLFGRNISPFSDAPIVTSILNDSRWSWLWLVIRLYLGYTWLNSGWGKITSAAWMDGGSALKGFFERAVLIPEAPARPAISFDWYRGFLQMILDGGHYVWFAKLIAVGEILIGIALVLGIFTGLAAFFGGFMNWNFMMAGTASLNPVMIILSIILILAWKNAGYLGLSQWTLPLIGVPWQPGTLFKKKA